MKRFDSKTMRMVNVGPKQPRPVRWIGTAEVIYADDPFADESPATDTDNLAGLVEVVSSLNVDDVIELIEAGEADLDDVIEAEKLGKGRKTVLALVKGPSGKVYPNSGKEPSA